MTSQDKLDILMNKVSQLEEAFKEERRLRVKYEGELEVLKNVTIPNLEKIILDKENLLKMCFVEKIKIEKELNCVLKNDCDKGLKLNIFRRDPTINKICKLEYYENAYKDLRQKYSILSDEKKVLENSCSGKLVIEKEKIEILSKQNENLESKILKNINEMKNLSESNSNLLIEIESLNSILEEISRDKENLLVLVSFYKSELDQRYLIFK
jgi:hypothetical protein